MSGQSAINRKRRLGDLLVLLVLATMVAVYCVDAVRASPNILNLILVLPVVVLVLVLCLFQFVLSARAVPQEEAEIETMADVLPVVILFAAYVISLEWLGFDIGTCLFLGAFLWLQGERRWQWLLGYSIAFAFALALFFSVMLPYPMPMLLLDSAY